MTTEHIVLLTLGLMVMGSQAWLSWHQRQQDRQLRIQRMLEGRS